MRCQTHAVPHFEALKPAVPPNFVGCCGQQTVETMANPAPYDIYSCSSLPAETVLQRRLIQPFNTDRYAYTGCGSTAVVIYSTWVAS